MSERPFPEEVLFAVTAGLAGVAGSFAVTGYSRQFIVHRLLLDKAETPGDDGRSNGPAGAQHSSPG